MRENSVLVGPLHCFRSDKRISQLPASLWKKSLSSTVMFVRSIRPEPIPFSVLSTVTWETRLQWTKLSGWDRDQSFHSGLRLKETLSETHNKPL
jgi:hypothetical protein